MRTNVLGIVAGLAVGTLIGILFAPKKGSKTRKQIKDKSNDVKDSIEHGFEDFVDAASKKYKSIVKSGDTILNRGEDFIEQEKARVKAKLNETY